MTYPCVVHLPDALTFLFVMEGSLAACEGRPAEANPYEPGSVQSQVWLRGWTQAHAEGLAGCEQQYPPR